ncbi:MAG: acyl-CoA dehydrogenase [SAR202 cluster bacterium Io17-Chloro-G2]|nr:MAG: acyl-CoA dehydrogenase [SAR202 cluster bacterium Io17-Chloro-G2]
MTTTMISSNQSKVNQDWEAVARELGPAFASRAAQHDVEGSFVAENFEMMRERKLFSAAVPAELGGGGASHLQMCNILREMAAYDASTALAFSMHSHLLAMLVWRYRHNLTPSSEPVLRKIAAEELVLISTGGSDWLDGSGVVEKADGGYRLKGRKIFGSGSPAGDLLLTMGVYDDPQEGPTVFHFAINLKDQGVSILDDWDTLGMRGTGSNNIDIDNVFFPEAGVSLRRPQGKWHGFFDILSPIAFSLIMSVYVGIAESAREIAVTQVTKKKGDQIVQEAIGEMETDLLGAQAALKGMLDIATTDFKPSIEYSNLICRYKTLVVRSAIRTVEKAMEAVGGTAYFRGLGLERCFRDVQAARYHPIQERNQYLFSGRIALGLDPVE